MADIIKEEIDEVTEASTIADKKSFMSSKNAPVVESAVVTETVKSPATDVSNVREFTEAEAALADSAARYAAEISLAKSSTK